MLRGVNTGGVSSTVAVYVDETPFGSSTGLVNGAVLAGDFDTFDIARIEVLRGPQGTLYGASSLGGVLKFVTNTPQLGQVRGARARRAGVRRRWRHRASMSTRVVNVPLGDMLAFRASGFYRKNGRLDRCEPVTTADFLGNSGTPTARTSTTARSGAAAARSCSSRATELTMRLTAIAQTHSNQTRRAVVEVDPDDYDPINGELSQTRFFPTVRTNSKYRLYNGAHRI